jgi:uncharacterized membrane protein YeaQ/YmgE (transglycosylase-associated protein family)
MELMELIILIVAMVIIGLFLGWLAGVIFKDDRPYGLAGDMGIAIVCTVLTGAIDWYVIPAMGFSDTLRNIGILIEPALVALLVLWLIRRAKR